MRLFVAVEIDPAVLDRIAACSAELRRRSAVAARARISWARPDRLHVTVRFIGEVDGGRAEAIVAALEPALSVAAFDLTVEDVGTFPAQGPPRVLWAGIARGLDALRAVEVEVSGRLDRCGIAREPRAYHPHVTLARVREAGGLRTAQWLDGLAGRQFGTSRVNAITLFQSRPSPQGHEYVALQRTALAT